VGRTWALNIHTSYTAATYKTLRESSCTWYFSWHSRQTVTLYALCVGTLWRFFHIHNLTSIVVINTLTNIFEHTLYYLIVIGYFFCADNSRNIKCLLKEYLFFFNLGWHNFTTAEAALNDSVAYDVAVVLKLLQLDKCFLRHELLSNDTKKKKLMKG
jgi:hypothetical protein